MASQKVFIDLVDNEAENQDLGHARIRALNGLEGMGKGKERGDKPSGYMAGTTQQREMAKLAKLMENEKRDLDFPLFNGSGDPHYHLKAYLDKLRKITESVIEEVMMHCMFGPSKTQSKDKGKVMIKPPKFKTRKPQVMTRLVEPPVIIFEMLRSHGILQPKNDGIPNPLRKDFDLNKHRDFHSGMQGYDTNEFCHLKGRDMKVDNQW
ncbi:hypothetical protein HAX54_004797 [Datura stramonium]|uniref:Uncharacterized protein n=1 Tax=Datura stramonium TaxID=4076 RepID=A0ABS8WX75_DATST|nr:hypothetical protein [Datura stramonium]